MLPEHFLFWHLMEHLLASPTVVHMSFPCRKEACALPGAAWSREGLTQATQRLDIKKPFSFAQCGLGTSRVLLNRWTCQPKRLQSVQHEHEGLVQNNTVLLFSTSCVFSCTTHQSCFQIPLRRCNVLSTVVMRKFRTWMEAGPPLVCRKACLSRGTPVPVRHPPTVTLTTPSSTSPLLQSP